MLDFFFVALRRDYIVLYNKFKLHSVQHFFFFLIARLFNIVWPYITTIDSCFITVMRV